MKKIALLRGKWWIRKSKSIRKSKNPRGPRLDWLNPDLQFVTTSKAKLKIRQWFRKQERQSNISRGTKIIKKESNKLGFKIDSKEVSLLPEFEDYSDLAEQLGSGETTIAQLAKSKYILEKGSLHKYN